jgi:hypothetical protein
MPILRKMKATMLKLKIPPEIMSQMEFDVQKDDGDDLHIIIPVIDKMDELLTKEQVLAVMERQGCCKSGKRDKDCKAFAKEHADKTLAEKIALLPNIQYMMAPQLNDDGTMTVEWGKGYQNGVHTGEATCSCGAIKKLKQPFSVSETYCGCCAGHFLYHYQNALGVKLKLKKINSSPLNTNGEKPCSFTFEIL